MVAAGFIGNIQLLVAVTVLGAIAGASQRAQRQLSLARFLLSVTIAYPRC